MCAGGRFSDPLHKRARFIDERAVRFEPQVLVKLVNRVSRTRGAQQEISFQQVCAAEIRIQAQRMLHLLVTLL